jgi:adenine-specific DNA-methyltransferase
MATGTPRKKFKGPGAKGGQRVSNPITLQYSGKIPSKEILKIQPSHIENVSCPHDYRGEGRLYFGENLGVLLALRQDPTVNGKVRLVYIDPPFATQTAFHSRSLTPAYEDALAGPEFIESLRQRLIILHQLLAEDGSLYLHLDAKMAFHMKIILDEIFGASNYRNCIIRKKCNPKNYTRKQYGNVSDYILFYSKSENYVWNKPVEEWTEERAKEYHYVEPKTGRRFMKVPVHAPGIRNGETGKLWRGMLPPPGKHWQYTPDKLDAMDAKGEIFWSSTGNPRRKVYLDESKGVGVQDIWLDFRDAHNQNICITGYPTEKNPALLERIILASSKPGDLVLDAFAGSGTSLAVASHLRRRWVGIDNSREAIVTILKRFETGLEKMGDFVEARNGKNPAKDAQRLLPFADLHQPITDYQLFATDEYSNEARDILRSWHKKHRKTV